MRQKFYILLMGLMILGIVPSIAHAETIIDSLTAPDPNIRKYFPRWRICENDIKIQIHQSFVILGYDKKMLDMNNIEVLAAPRTDVDLPYEILSISCGKAHINSNEINNNIPQLAEYINGTYSFRTTEELAVAKRDYCYSEIPAETPVTESQAKAILSYLEPTHVDHAITASLFEQSLKIGSSDFWLKSIIGNDPAGLMFWSAGEAKVVLKRPLYVNDDEESRERIPNLANAYLGASYRITSGIEENTHNALSWVSRRLLNSGPSAKMVAGFEVFMPFHPEFGVSFNVDVPVEKMNDKAIDEHDLALLKDSRDVESNRGEIDGIAPMLRGTGQFTLFYNWWLNKEKAENFFRFDLGIAYAEVNEMVLYYDSAEDCHKITRDAIGLKTYKPHEFGDWVYAKVEYRNQASYPFGASIQYSNQTILGRIYLPIVNWLYIEGKYSTPLRHAYPFEVKNFFVISPVLRITL